MKRLEFGKCLLLGALTCTSVMATGTEKKRPNILIILTDDSGYSDPGCYGGEIETPNIDKLACNGLRFRTFYNNARCSPTRASLLTGRDCAFAGFGAGTLGGWNREMHLPAYRARLNSELPTIAEVMKASGYHTMMTGKWHLGGSIMKEEPSLQPKWERSHKGWELTPQEIEADFNALPLQRGFDEFFGVIPGETHHFFTKGEDHDYLEGNQHARLAYDRTYTMHCYAKDPDRYPYTKNHGVTAPAFYDTDGVTDRAIELLRNACGEGKAPFFMYVAYRAPHLPLQAPQELVNKYLLLYKDLETVELNRVRGLEEENIFPKGKGFRKEFEGSTQRSFAEDDDFKLRLAIHAAMIEKVDENVGRIVGILKELEELNNTLIIYLSDNGAAGQLGEMMNKPYYGCKALLWEGGAKTHCIAHWPGMIKPGGITGSIGWVGDLLPTCLAVAGGKYPEIFHGKKTEPLDGRNILPILKGEEMLPPEYLFFNDRGQQSVVYQGRWKLLIQPGWYAETSRRPGISYELYDLQSDPGETENLEKQKPDLVTQLSERCETWQKECGITDYAEIEKTGNPKGSLRRK